VQYANDLRDIQGLMIDEKWGMGVTNGGRFAVKAKNVRVDENYRALFTTRSITVS
jgi:hypothetical protein